MTKTRNPLIKGLITGLVIGILILISSYVPPEKSINVNQFCIEKGYDFGNNIGVETIECSIYLNENYDKQSIENPVIIHKLFKIEDD